MILIELIREKFEALFKQLMINRIGVNVGVGVGVGIVAGVGAGVGVCVVVGISITARGP